MCKPSKETDFQPINPGYNSVFQAGRLSLGLVVPVENYATSAVPTLQHHLERVQMAEELGFSAVWLRDVPFNVPSFGDAGQVYDPFVYLGLLAGQTKRIALGVASIILPLRHPAHIAKAASSVDVLSGGRLILGVASGDRPEEYPALRQPFEERGQSFRESFDYLRRMSETSPRFENAFGSLSGNLDLLPKPHSGKLPLLVTGGSRQSPEWIAQNSDGWMTYPRHPLALERIRKDWKTKLQDADLSPKPLMQPLYIDLEEDPDAPPRPIHLGFRLGAHPLRKYLKVLENSGMHHVALNLRFNRVDIELTLKRLAEDILPDFSY